VRPKIETQLLTESEAAEFLGISRSWLQKGRIYDYGPAYLKMKEPRGVIRYRLSDLLAFIDERTKRPSQTTRVK
jgi:hypothetical protein